MDSPVSDHDENTDTPTADADTVPEYRGAGIMWGAIGLAVVLVVFVIVVIQNADSVEFDFLWLTATTPLSLIIAVAVAASLAVGELVGFVWRRRRRSDLQRREDLRRFRDTQD